MSWSRESRHKRGYGSAWVKLRERIMRRDLYLCQPCKTKGRTTPAKEVHHVIAKAHGGTDDPGNLTAICKACHDEDTRAQKGERERVRFGADGRVQW